MFSKYSMDAPPCLILRAHPLALFSKYSICGACKVPGPCDIVFPAVYACQPLTGTKDERSTLVRHTPVLPLRTQLPPGVRLDDAEVGLATLARYIL